MLNPDFRDILSAFTGERVKYLLVGAYTLAGHRLARRRMMRSASSCVARIVSRQVLKVPFKTD